MRLVQIRASNEKELDCLVRELTAYSAKRSRRSVLVEVAEDSQTELLGLLSALEVCLEVHDIRSVRLKLDGQNYTLDTQ
jgi:hypothetical protein